MARSDSRCYEKIVGAMPKSRGNEPSQAYRELATTLVRTYEAVGQSRQAEGLRHAAGLR